MAASATGGAFRSVTAVSTAAVSAVTAAVFAVTELVNVSIAAMSFLSLWLCCSLHSARKWKIFSRTVIILCSQQSLASRRMSCGHLPKRGHSGWRPAGLRRVRLEAFVFQAVGHIKHHLADLVGDPGGPVVRD